jgi:nucleoside 2-deoxyribosyltransferase
MRGGGKWVDHLDHIARIVKALGHIPLTEACPPEDLTVKIEGSGDNWIFDRDMAWLRMADCLIAEVSSPSIGVGYEIAVAIHEGKVPVLALCHESVATLSAMIHGNTESIMELKRYSDIEDMRAKISGFLSKITG